LHQGFTITDKLVTAIRARFPGIAMTSPPPSPASRAVISDPERVAA